jgi:hypothetical protein
LDQTEFRKLVINGVVVKLEGNQRILCVDRVVLSRNVFDGHIADENGEYQANYGSEHLAAVGAGLLGLQLHIFAE